MVQIDVPLGINVPASTNVFDLKDLEVRHSLNDGYNKPETGSSPLISANSGNSFITVADGSLFQPGDNISMFNPAPAPGKREAYIVDYVNGNIVNLKSALTTTYTGSVQINNSIDINRPNISFDARRTNVEGRYTDVNSRVQVSNTDYPMFANSFLTYIEQDPVKLETNKHDTYAQWVGTNTAPPVRILNRFSGKVEPQTTGNFLLSNDGLDNYYDTDTNGAISHMYVDEALAINTGRITNKLPTAESINQEKNWLG